jgi:hypothetical protein
VTYLPPCNTRRFFARQLWPRPTRRLATRTCSTASCVWRLAWKSTTSTASSCRHGSQSPRLFVFVSSFLPVCPSLPLSSSSSLFLSLTQQNWVLSYSRTQPTFVSDCPQLTCTVQRRRAADERPVRAAAVQRGKARSAPRSVTGRFLCQSMHEQSVGTQPFVSRSVKQSNCTSNSGAFPCARL